MLEKGYTRIANELFEAILKHPFSKRELNVVLSVIRKTYGYNGKKHDAVSAVQIASMTGIDRSHLSKTINDLIEKNVLVKKGKGRLSHGKHIKSIGINKRYKMWLTVAKTAPVIEKDCSQNSHRSVAKTATLTVAKTAHTKEKKEKRKGESLIKKFKQQVKSISPDDDEYSVCRKIGLELDINPFDREPADDYVDRVKNALH